MATARADKSATFVNLPFFGHVVDIASFWTIWMRWPLVDVAWMAMAYVATYLLANYLYFRVLGCANLFKLASVGQFAETNQNSQHG
jgi:hypothetical protein